MKADLPFHQRPVYIRQTHTHGFRSGQWALCAEIVWLPEAYGPRPRPGRACFRVEFIDGVNDLWPVDDPNAGYEFAHFLPRPA